MRAGLPLRPLAKVAAHRIDMEQDQRGENGKDHPEGRTDVTGESLTQGCTAKRNVPQVNEGRKPSGR